MSKTFSPVAKWFGNIWQSSEVSVALVGARKVTLMLDAETGQGVRFPSDSDLSKAAVYCSASARHVAYSRVSPSNDFPSAAATNPRAYSSDVLSTLAVICFGYSSGCISSVMSLFEAPNCFWLFGKLLCEVSIYLLVSF
jgi:hypothetical protein